MIKSVNTKGTLESEELEKLREFNESKNESRRKREEREREIEKKGHGDSDSSSSSSEDEDDTEGKKKEETKKEEEPPKLGPTKGPVIDDDGFEVVTTEKKVRRGGK